MADPSPHRAEMIPLSREKAGGLMKAATYASVTVAAVLICAKTAAWMATDSVSLLSTLVDSLLDAAASLINLFAVRHALQPADREHRFGHGKAESLAGLAQAAFIGGSALFLLLQAAGRFITPRAVVEGDLGVAVMLFSIAMTVLLVVFQKHVIRKTGSMAISADSLHYQADLLVNAGVIVSLLLASRLGWQIADPLFAVAIGVFIMRGAYDIGSGALQQLMDRELPDEERERIRAIVLAHPDVHGMHDLRTRSTGADLFIQLHLEMEDDLTLTRAHRISDTVMYAIRAAYPNADVIIHEDPKSIAEAVATFE